MLPAVTQISNASAKIMVLYAASSSRQRSWSQGMGTIYLLLDTRDTVLQRNAKVWAPQSGRTWSYGCPLNSFSFHHHKREYKTLLPFIFHWLHKLFSWQDSATAFHLSGWTDWAFLVDSIKIDAHSDRTNSSGRELLQWVILRQSLYTSFSNSLNSLNDTSAQKQ